MTAAALHTEHSDCHVVSPPTWRGRGLSKSFISKVIIGVTPFRVLVTLLITYLLSPLPLQAESQRESARPATGSPSIVGRGGPGLEINRAFGAEIMKNSTLVPRASGRCKHTCMGYLLICVCTYEKLYTYMLVCMFVICICKRICVCISVCLYAYIYIYE